jgi:hypothetical protein
MDYINDLFGCEINELKAKAKVLNNNFYFYRQRKKLISFVPQMDFQNSKERFNY